MKRHLRHIGYILLILLAAVACKQGGDKAASFSPSETIHKTYEQQPVRLDYTVNSSVVRVVDRLKVALSFQAPEDYDVVFPKLEASLGEFEVADQYEDLPELAEKGLLRHKKTILLEPTLAGEYSIPPFKIDYWQKENPDNVVSLTTDGIKITIGSLLEKEQQKIDISDIAPPVSMPSTRIFWILGGVLFAALAVGGLLWRRSKRNGREDASPPEPAHRIAFKALDRLLAGDLLKEGRIKEFYLAISNILRRYIEHRFSLHAPERTTEEFLTELGGTDILQLQHKTLLKEFLLHCDQVKFAKYQPVDEEIEKTMTLCRQFINDTKEADMEGGQKG